MKQEYDFSRGKRGAVLKKVLYYCPSCRKTVERTVRVAHRKRRSYCLSTGKAVVMRLRKAK